MNIKYRLISVLVSVSLILSGCGGGGGSSSSDIANSPIDNLVYSANENSVIVESATGKRLQVVINDSVSYYTDSNNDITMLHTEDGTVYEVINNKTGEYHQVENNLLLREARNAVAITLVILIGVVLYQHMQDRGEEVYDEGIKKNFEDLISACTQNTSKNLSKITRENTCPLSSSQQGDLKNGLEFLNSDELLELVNYTDYSGSYSIQATSEAGSVWLKKAENEDEEDEWLPCSNGSGTVTIDGDVVLGSVTDGYGNTYWIEGNVDLNGNVSSNFWSGNLNSDYFSGTFTGRYGCPATWTASKN